MWGRVSINRLGFLWKRRYVPPTLFLISFTFPFSSSAVPLQLNSSFWLILFKKEKRDMFYPNNKRSLIAILKFYYSLALGGESCKPEGLLFICYCHQSGPIESSFPIFLVLVQIFNEYERDKIEFDRLLQELFMYKWSCIKLNLWSLNPILHHVFFSFQRIVEIRLILMENTKVFFFEFL